MIKKILAILAVASFFMPFSSALALTPPDMMAGHTQITENDSATNSWSLYFDGTDGNLAQLQNLDALNKTNITVSFRAKIPSTGPTLAYNLLANYNGWGAGWNATQCQPGIVGWSLYIENGLLKMSECSGTNVQAPFAGSATISKDDWHEISFTNALVSGHIETILYCDGARIAAAETTLFSPIYTNNATTKYGVGDYDNSSGKLSNVYIDDMRFYGMALSPTQINALFLRQSVGVNPDSYWDFEKTPQTLSITAVTGQAGTLNSTSIWNGDTDVIATRSYYGGMSGNYAILNNDPVSDMGFKYDSTDPSDALTNCNTSLFGTGNLPLTLGLCFILGTGLNGAGILGGNYKSMSSISAVGTKSKIETPSVFMGSSSISGDVFGLDNSLDNFAFWGTNLHRGATNMPTSDAAWKIQGPLNLNAQARWDRSEFKKYISKLNLLASEGTLLTDNQILGSASTLWYANNTCQGNGCDMVDLATDTDNAMRQKKYPNGRVWTIDCHNATVPGAGSLCSGNTVKINSNITYSGVGTLIIKGSDLEFEDGANFTAADDSSHLGIIVLDGNITMTGNNTIQAVMLAYDDPSTALAGGAIQLGATGNIDMTGSFVANDFSFDTTGNVRFYYDYDLDSAWPPGFMDLKMPKPSS